MNEMPNISTSRRNGQGHVNWGSQPSHDGPPTDIQGRIARTETALGIRIYEDHIEPTIEGIIACAKEHHIPMMDPKTIKWLVSFGYVATGAVGIVYGSVLCKMRDGREPVENLLLMIAGIIFAIAGSKIISTAWSRYIRNSFQARNKSSGLVGAAATTMLIALVDFLSVGYFLHSILTEDLFGVPSSTLTLVASYGVALMTTTVLVMISRLIGIEEAWHYISKSIILDRALNTYHAHIAECRTMLQQLTSDKSQENLMRHMP